MDDGTWSFLNLSSAPSESESSSKSSAAS
jgi:hypothetical protein